ncbi:MAG: hypothetical protein ACLR3C_14965 [Eggerthella lenta]
MLRAKTATDTAAASAWRRGRNRGARYPPAQNGDEQVVQHDVRHTRCDRHREAHLRLLRRDEEAQEHVLHDEQGQRHQQDAPVQKALL